MLPCFCYDSFPTQPTQSSSPNTSREEDLDSDGLKEMLFWLAVANTGLLLFSTLFNSGSLVMGISRLKKVKHERYNRTSISIFSASFQLFFGAPIWVLATVRFLSYRSIKYLTLGHALLVFLSLIIFLGIYNNTD